MEYLRDVKRFLRLARRYWFDALILAGVGIGVSGAVLGRDRTDGPEGPLWFDVLAILAIVLPLLAGDAFRSVRPSRWVSRPP